MSDDEWALRISMALRSVLCANICALNGARISMMKGIRR